MKKIKNIIFKISDLVSYISFIGIVAMMILIAVDVFMRKAFDAAITGSYEIVQYLLMMVVFSSFGFAQTKKMHVRVTLFMSLFHWRVHTILNGFWEFLCAVTSGFVAYAAFVHAAYLYEKAWTSDVLGFKTFPFYYFEGVMMIIFTLVLLCDSIRYFAAAGNREVAEETFKEYS